MTRLCNSRKQHSRRRGTAEAGGTGRNQEIVLACVKFEIINVEKWLAQ